MTVPSLASRVASQAIAFYLRHVPVARGKTRLFQTAARYGLVAQIRNGLWLRTSGLTEAEHQFVLGQPKEPETVTLFESLITPDMVCVDVGANIGYYTVLLARAAQIVHAIEPTLELVTRIRENAALNGMCNVVVHHAAVGEHIGSADLYISTEDPEANSLHGSGPTVRVRLTTLDALALPRVDLLKLDCEGSELAALRGAVKTINRDRPLILCECNTGALGDSGHTVRDLTDALHIFGYTIYQVEQLRADVWNLLASPRQHNLPLFRQSLPYP